MTEKEKKWAELRKSIANTNNALNNHDFDKVWDNVQEMFASIEKAQKLVDK